MSDYQDGRMGKVFLLGAGPGDPDLLTIKARNYLKISDVVVYDRLVSPDILELCPRLSQRVYVGKETGHHSLPQGEINRLLAQHALAGSTVARLKGGDPFVFGRGGEEALFLAKRGIPFEVVPGVTSAVAAPACAGIPLTHRGIASGFHVVTGHDALSSRKVEWEILSQENETLVVLMGVHSLGEIARVLMSHGRQADTPVAVIEWGTTPKQRVVTSTLSRIETKVMELGVAAPAVIVIGDVVRLRESLRWFPLESLE